MFSGSLSLAQRVLGLFLHLVVRVVLRVQQSLDAGCSYRWGSTSTATDEQDDSLYLFMIFYPQILFNTRFCNDSLKVIFKSRVALNDEDFAGRQVKAS